MEYIHRMRGVAGGRPAVGAAFLVTISMLSCKPGSLPCDQDEWQEVCYGDGGGSTNTGGGGGAGGNSAGMGGAAGGSPKCTKWTTAAEVAEKLILPTCGGAMGTLCHTSTFEPKFKTVDEILPALLDKTPLMLCKMDKLVNKAEPGKSYFVAKAKNAMPNGMVSCPTGGGNGGLRMPYMLPVLAQADIDCLEWWAYEVSK